MRCRNACLYGTVLLLTSGFQPVAVFCQETTASDAPTPLSILVADPLSKDLACDCVAGFAQRRYEALALVLEKRLHRPVRTFSGAKLSAYWSDEQPISLIVGKYSDVIYQARELGRPVYPIAALTDKQGLTTFQGLFVVRTGNAAESLSDIQDYRVILGPAACDEKHRAAIDALHEVGAHLPSPEALETVPSCTDAANELMKLTDQDKAVAVISDYARVLLEGCHTIPKDSLRVIGKTGTLPFVTVFATAEVAPELRTRIQEELLAANKFPSLLRLLESKSGFQRVSPESSDDLSRGWYDFRGPHRTALVPALPASLEDMRTVWTAALEGRGLGGLAITPRWVVVTDRIEETRSDYVKLLDVFTGELRFSGHLVEPTEHLRGTNLDYGNSIRTTPVVRDGFVYLLDAYGTLYKWPLPTTDAFPPTDCVTGKSTALLVDDYELVRWGVSSTPLFTSDSDGQRRLICNSCSTSHSLLAFDPDSLEVRWSGIGHSTGYASCIEGQWGSRHQVVGYDAQSLGGWDIHTGERIWSVFPEVKGDFNVPTPISLDDRRILVVTESNGMRIYAFDEHGVLQNKPVAENLDVNNDTVTPVVVAGKAYCTSDGTLVQLEVERGLAECWRMADSAFADHVSLLADEDGRHLLVTTFRGELLLFDIQSQPPRLISRREAFRADEREEIYSHPSLVGKRLYLRGLQCVRCLQL